MAVKENKYLSIRNISLLNVIELEKCRYRYIGI